MMILRKVPLETSLLFRRKGSWTFGSFGPHLVDCSRIISEYDPLLQFRLRSERDRRDSRLEAYPLRLP